MRPLGPVMVTVEFEELIATPPISMAPGRVVVTAGAVRLLTAEALATVLAGASSGVVVLTPLYRAMPPLEAAVPESVQL